MKASALVVATEFLDRYKGGGVDFFLKQPENDDGICELIVCVTDCNQEVVESSIWFVDINDDKPLSILFNDEEADKEELDGEDCLHRFFPFI